MQCEDRSSCEVHLNDLATQRSMAIKESQGKQKNWNKHLQGLEIRNGLFLSTILHNPFISFFSVSFCQCPSTVWTKLAKVVKGNSNIALPEFSFGVSVREMESSRPWCRSDLWPGQREMCHRVSTLWAPHAALTRTLTPYEALHIEQECTLFLFTAVAFQFEKVFYRFRAPKAFDIGKECTSFCNFTLNWFFEEIHTLFFFIKLAQ